LEHCARGRAVPRAHTRALDAVGTHELEPGAALGAGALAHPDDLARYIGVEGATGVVDMDQLDLLAGLDPLELAAHAESGLAHVDAAERALGLADAEHQLGLGGDPQRLAGVRRRVQAVAQLEAESVKLDLPGAGTRCRRR